MTPGRHERRGVHAGHERVLRGAEDLLALGTADAGGDGGGAAQRVPRRLGGGRGEAGDGVVHAATVAAGQHGPEDRHAERAARGPRRVVDRGADARLGERQRAHDGVGGRRHRVAHAEAEHDQGGGHEPVGAAGVGEAEQRQADRRRTAGRPATTSFAPIRSVMRADSGPATIRPAAIGQRAETGLERAVAEDALEVLGEEEDRPEQREEGQRDGDARGREAAVAEQRGVEHRRRGAPLPGGERGQRRGGEGEPPRTGPSVQPRSGASMIAHTSAVSPAVESAKPRHVERGRRRVAGLRHEEAPAQQRDRDHRQVDEEDPAPVACSTSQPPATGPDRDADAGHAGPDADRPAALVRREHGGQDRQRRGHDERAAEAHQRPRGDQHPRAGGDRRGGGTGAEDQQAERQRAPAAEAVAERAGGEQQAGEHEHVGVHDPLELRRGRAELAFKRRQRDVEDRVVEAR